MIKNRPVVGMSYLYNGMLCRCAYTVRSGMEDEWSVMVSENSDIDGNRTRLQAEHYDNETRGNPAMPREECVGEWYTALHPGSEYDELVPAMQEDIGLAQAEALIKLAKKAGLL